MIYLIVSLFLSFSSFASELQDFEIPECPHDIERFKKSKLKAYVKHYNGQTKEGIFYFNSILKSDYDIGTVNRTNLSPLMVNYWYIHEIFNLEKKRRTKRSLKRESLMNLLRNVSLIPKKIRKHIAFPPSETLHEYRQRTKKYKLGAPKALYDADLGWQQ